MPIVFVRLRLWWSMLRPFIPLKKWYLILSKKPWIGFDSLIKRYRKIPKISPGAYISQRPFSRGLFLEGLIFGWKFAFPNRLG